jgi:hypothetical protein
VTGTSGAAASDRTDAPQWVLKTANPIEKLSAGPGQPATLGCLSKRLSGHVGGVTCVSDRHGFGPSQSLGEGRKHRQQQIEVPLRDAN